MKRDLDLVRAILITAENSDEPIELRVHSANLVSSDVDLGRGIFEGVALVFYEPFKSIDFFRCKRIDVERNALTISFLFFCRLIACPIKRFYCRSNGIEFLFNS